MTKKFKIKLEDGTVCNGEFPSEADARDFYDIFYRMQVVSIREIED